VNYRAVNVATKIISHSWKGALDLTAKNRRLAIPALLAIVALVASCTPAQQGTSQPSPTVCDGISSEVGGCTANRHTFISDTCEDLAREWATVLNEGVVGVLRGPAEVGNQARSVLLRQVVVISTVDLNSRLAELGLRGTCKVPEFMATAEPVFSAELRAGVGDAMYDSLPPASYEEWLADVQNTVRIIDDGS
jgi:hypothetical protein